MLHLCGQRNGFRHCRTISSTWFFSCISHSDGRGSLLQRNCDGFPGDRRRLRLSEKSDQRFSGRMHVILQRLGAFRRAGPWLCDRSCIYGGISELDTGMLRDHESDSRKSYCFCADCFLCAAEYEKHERREDLPACHHTGNCGHYGSVLCLGRSVC